MKFRRSLLFVPGIRPDRYLKAIGSGADMVCIDLEDSVSFSQKDTARDTVLNFLNSHDFTDSGCELIIRINILTSIEGLKDIVAIAESKIKPDAIMLTKVNHQQDVKIADSLLSDTECEIFALIETPEGLSNAKEILTASSRLTAAMFGGGDYAATVGSDLSWDSLLYARSQMVAAAKNKITLIDVPFMNFNDHIGLESETQKIKNLGYNSKAAIHPSQVSIIHKGLKPSQQEIERAKKIVSTYYQSDQGVVVVDGYMVDQPIVLAAQKILELSKSHI